MEYTVYLFGETACEVAENYIGGKCYCGVFDDGRRMGQMEHVAENLVAISYIAESDVSKVVELLHYTGFSGIRYCVEREFVDDNGHIMHEDGVSGII